MNLNCPQGINLLKNFDMQTSRYENNNHHNQDYYAVVADSDNHRILIIDIDNDRIVHSIGPRLPVQVLAIDITNDGNILAKSDYRNQSIKYYSLLPINM
jgi:hypothetical protein